MLILSHLPPLDPAGAAAALACLCAGLMPRRGLILGVSALGSALFCLHFLRLGSTTGAAMCLISVVQCLAAIRLAPGARPAWLTGLFGVTSAAVVALTLATWAGPASALAGAGTLLATAARLQADAQRMRQVLLACSACWLGHNLILGSLFALTSDLLTITTLSLALWRYRPAGAGVAA